MAKRGSKGARMTAKGRLAGSAFSRKLALEESSEFWRHEGSNPKEAATV